MPLRQQLLRLLILVAEHNGPTMMARIGMMKALNRHLPPPTIGPRRKPVKTCRIVSDRGHLLTVGLWWYSASMDRRGFLNLGMIGASAAVASAATYFTIKYPLFSSGCYVQMGTSITAGGSGAKSGSITPIVVGDRIRRLGVNAAIPGSCAGVHKFAEVNPFSLFALVDSIVSQDWSVQNAARGFAFRDAAISRLMMAFPDVAYLGLEYGTNDFRYDRPIGSAHDRSGATFIGALNYSVEKLLEAFPRLRVFLITPAWMPTIDGRDSDEHPNALGCFLKEYVDAMLHAAELNHIPCLDFWRGLGLNKYNYKAFTLDGTHPNDLGALERGERIASFIQATF